MLDKDLFALSPRARRTVQRLFNGIVISIAMGIAWGVLMALAFLLNIGLSYLIKATEFEPAMESVVLQIPKAFTILFVLVVTFRSAIDVFRISFVDVPEEL